VPPRPRLLGSPWVTAVCLFPCALRRLARRPFPGTVQVRLRLLSPKANSPSEFLLLNHCFRLSTSATTYLGFGPLPDITAARPLNVGTPNPYFVPSSGALSLSTVYSALQLAGLFHPARQSSGPLPVQGFPTPHRCCFSSKQHCLHVVGARCARPQAGCHEPSSPTSRLCSMRSRVPKVR